MDRWPPYGGGRKGRFDCIYIYITVILLKVVWIQMFCFLFQVLGEYCGDEI